MPFWTFQFSYQLCAAQIHQAFLGWMGFQVGGKKRSFLNAVLHTVMLRKNGQQSKYLTLLRRCRKMFYTTRTSRPVYALQLQTKDATIQEEARYVFHSLYWLVHTGVKIHILSKKSQFENLNFHKIHIFKFTFFTKFTFSK